MKKGIKILSALLAVLMLCGAVTVGAGAFTLYDENGNAEGSSKFNSEAIDYDVTIEKNLESSKFSTPQEKVASMDLMWEKNGYRMYVDPISGEVATEKIATGELLFTNPWDLSDASYTAVTAGKKSKTTAISVKKQLLSQIVITYIDNNNPKDLYSSLEAAARNQINVEYIKNGIRIEYSIGREEARMLVPMRISKDRFEKRLLREMRETANTEDIIVIDTSNQNNYTLINNQKVFKYQDALNQGAEEGEEYGYYDYVIKFLDPTFDMEGEPLVAEKLKKSDYGFEYECFAIIKFTSYYNEKNLDKEKTDAGRSSLLAMYPIVKTMPIYVIDKKVQDNTSQMRKVESYIKDYASTYTYEELDSDHDLTQYEATAKSPVLFKVALEYTVDEDGLVVRMPANGIRFDESIYLLENIEMLPYMGAGRNDGDWSDGGDGYTFFPDGSGALFDFQQLNDGSHHDAYAQIYGTDFAYHTLSGQHQETIRVPVFGIVEHWSGKKTDYTKVIKQEVLNEDGTVKTPAVYGTKDVDEDHGFLAIIEEGDALARLTTVHMSAKSIYNMVKMSFYPRPKDSYNMADAISVGSNKEMTVVSERKYVGNYKVRYVMLSDDTLARENNLSRYYECSWMGMAVAYRDYLEKQNVLTRLTDSDVSANIPLYIETYGALMTTEKIFSIPVDVMTPLTTFEDVKTMYNELSGDIKKKTEELVNSGNTTSADGDNVNTAANINFKLTGYANGGLYSVMPYNLNWEKAVGGASGFADLVKYSKEKNFGVFPDFDFVYSENQANFDGVDLKTDAVKTIDNRYTMRRYFSATYQAYVGYYELAISASRFDKFITKLLSNYLKYDPTGISVATLGTDLNSDFDEEDPLNREDSKEYTIDALRKLSLTVNSAGDALKIMTSGGNAYTWRYADYIVNMPLNSSRYNDSSNAVPFLGVVLHGYLQFSGTPINEEGDIEYAFLKAIENGAGLYFVISYQNTQKLKDDFRLSEHYSVRYDIWRDDLVDMYVELNDLLSDLQTKLIIDHEFLIGNRVPDPDEVIEDEENKRKEEELKAAEEAAAAARKELAEALALRKTPMTQAKATEAELARVAAYINVAAKHAALIDKSYVDICADLAKASEKALKAANEAQKAVYSVTGYNRAEADAASSIESRIKSAVDAAIREATDVLLVGVTDEAKKAEITAKVNDIATKLKNAAANAGAAEAAGLVANAGTYFSAAEEAAAKAAAAAEIIDAVADGLGNESASLTVTADEADRAIISEVAESVTENVLASFKATDAEAVYNTTKSTYDKAVTETTDNIKRLAQAVANRTNTANAALAAGISEADLANAIALSEAKYTAIKKVSAAKESETLYNNAFYDYKAKIASYYAELKKTYDTYAGSNAALKDALAKLATYEQANADAEAAEALAGVNPSDSNKDSATSARKTADDRKAEYDALPEADRNAAKAAADAVAAAVAANTDTAYATLAKLASELSDAKAAVSAAAPGYAEYQVLLTKSEAALKAYNENKFALEKKAADENYNTVAAAYNAVAGSDTIRAAKEITALADALSKATTGLEAAKTTYDAAKEVFDKTGLEEAAYNTAKTAYETALTVMTTAQADLDAARNASAHKTEFEAVEKAYSEQLAAKANNDLITAIDGYIKTEVDGLFGASAEMIDAVNKTADYLIKSAKATEASATYRTYISKIDSAVSSIKSSISTMKNSVSLAEAATKSLKEKYEEILADPTATAIEKQSAKQFYESAVANTKKASDNLAALEKDYDELRKLTYNEALTKAKVIIFGQETVDADSNAVTEALRLLNNALNVSEEALKVIDAEWKKMVDAAKRYTESAHALETMANMDFWSMSKAEKEEYKANLVIYSYRKSVAEEELRDANEALSQSLLTFKDNNGYRNLARYRNSAETALQQLLVDLEYAETLKNLYDADATATEEDKAYAAGKYNDLKALCDKYSAMLEKADALLAQIRASALEQELIDENFEITSNTKAQDLFDATLNTKKHNNTVIESTKYTSSDGSIVAVTYGGKDGDDNKAYRTFILNYNSFAIIVTYNGVEYTIPAYGYKVINH